MAQLRQLNTAARLGGLDAQFAASRSAKPRSHHAFRPRASAASTKAGSKKEGVRLLYRSEGTQSRVKFSVSKGPWAEVEGQQLLSSAGAWEEVYMETDGGQVEFVVTDGGANFTVDESGIYVLQNNQLEPQTAPRYMVVSDLDGTMVGDDETTLRFKEYWESQAVLRGCRLVFSTGRTLSQYLELAEEKAGYIAQPDALISAVGTRVYNQVTLGAWEEDAGWTAALDSMGWDEQVVKDSCASAIELCSDKKMHFRPPNELNSHKITCGVHVDVLAQAEEHIKAKVAAKNVQAKLITSGKGDWRYLDIVPTGAGKLESLEYVRQKVDISSERTVACGDSGNDIDMFVGRNLSIVVGNAQPDLVAWLDANTPTLPPLADGTPRIVRAKAHVADGILEGLKRFGLY